MVCGEPGVGKTALLDCLASRAAAGFCVVRAVGVQSEMELAFAGLHQLLAPMLDHLERLPVPQSDALRTAFGLSAGPAPDRFLVGLAALSLLSEAAAQRPLLCLVDDQQWLDRASAQALGFVARRLEVEPVGLVFAARKPTEDVAGLPKLDVENLGEGDARALLDSVLIGPLDERVRDLIVAETRGNPLALLELPRGLTPAELAGGFGLPFAAPLAGGIEDSFRRRIEALPAETRRVLHVAAADPTGDPSLVWRATGRLAIDPEAAASAAATGLIEFDAWVQFRHPLAKSAAYRSASPQDRYEVHRALSEVTDPEVDPDRKAWHRAQATPGPDEEVAAELERSADRAQARGGLAAVAAFLERAAVLTPEPARRTERLLAAARAKRDVGALDAALGLLAAIEAEPREPLQAAMVQYQRGQIALAQQRFRDAARLLLSAARRIESFNPGLARETHLDALTAAMWAGDLDNPNGVRKAAEAARAAPATPAAPRVVDVLLDAMAIRLTDGSAAAAPTMIRAVELALEPSLSDGEIGPSLRLSDARAGTNLAFELWDVEAAQTLATHMAQTARDTGAFVHLQVALNLLAMTHILAGDLATAELVIEEDRLIGEAIGNPPLGTVCMHLAAWRGQEAPASELIEASLREATKHGVGRSVDSAGYASAVLYNGLGRHDAARDAAWPAFRHDPLGSVFLVPELAEAASRTGDTAMVRAALESLSESAQAAKTDWALGMEARVRALLSEGEAAEDLYRESISLLGHGRVRAELARGHLLYGEWLRRRRRRMDARRHLRTAHDMLDAMGIKAFAERARRELLATGETARKRTAETAAELTPQEANIARLARDGLSNPEIGVRLFISARTVGYHLSKVFAKLAISSRIELDRCLLNEPATAQPS